MRYEEWSHSTTTSSEKYDDNAIKECLKDSNTIGNTNEQIQSFNDFDAKSASAVEEEKDQVPELTKDQGGESSIINNQK